jgi:RraA family protein
MNEQKIGFRVIEDIPRPEPELIEKLRKYSTCELCDGMILYNAMDYHIKPMVGTKKICGPAVTLKQTLGDSLLVTKAISVAKPGDVLVIDGRGSGNNALWGDHRSLICKKIGLEGVVMDGAFRDIEENEEIGFPIYAKAVTCGTSTKNSNGEVNVQISCGGVVVNPGDIIVGDRNGICVITPEFIEQVIAGADQKIAKLNRLKEEIDKEGKLIPDNFAASLEKLGY